jgi:type VI secretion system secreted protein VgrG
MAQLTQAFISINGKSIRQFSSFSLAQGIFEHHYFRLTCPAESIDGNTGAVFNQSKTLMGATLVARVNSVEAAGQLEFKGIVTQVETERYSGSSGDVVITGYSATIMLESGPHCKSWEKKAVKNIVQDVLKHFPKDFDPKVSPKYGETISYYVQYKETAWRFLNRICSTFGEWLYFDGSSLIVGPPLEGETASLIYGNNLSRFSMSLQVSPPSMKVMAYDYMNHRVYNSTPEEAKTTDGLNDLGKQALQASRAVYTTEPKVWNNNFLTNKKQLDDVVNIQSSMRSSNYVRFTGSSGHPGVAVGGKISVRGQNMYSLANEEHGEFTVISVNHYTDGQGNYSNDFVAIPASIKVPPVATLPEPVCETQSAMVTDNHDPKGLGRIRVKFHWMNGAEKTPWIRVTSPHGGGGKGMFFIPEIDEEVIAGFEGDSSTKPYVIGTVYHGKANNSYSNAGNDVKALQTRGGNQIIMNDKAKSIYLSDGSGNNTMHDGNGNIITTSSESIKLQCGASCIEMKKDGTITINGKNISTTGTETVSTKTKIRKVDVDDNLITAKNNIIKGDKNHIAGESKMDGGNVFIN